MKRFTLSGLPVLIALLAFLGICPNVKADVNPDNPFASVYLDPPAGQIDDITKLQTIKFCLPTQGADAGEMYISKFNISLNKIVLRKDNGDGTYTVVGGGKYTKATAADSKKTEWTLTYDKDLSTLDLTPGKYEIYLQKSGCFAIFGGGLSVAKNSPANLTFSYEYAPGGSAGVEYSCTPAKGGIVSADDFTGFTVAFDGVSKVELASETFDGATLTRDGTDVAILLKNNDLTFGFMRGTELPGIWEFAIPEGFYKLTLADGSVVDSPAINSYCYVGEIGVTTTPANGATVPFDTFSNYTVSFPSMWTVALGDKDLRKQAYFEVGGNKQMWGTYVFLADDTTWEPTLDEINITEPSVANVYIPAGTYVLTAQGKEFLSPEINFSFTLEPVVEEPVTLKASTTPANGAYYDGTLNQFSVAFTCAEQEITNTEAVNLSSRFISLSYGEVGLNYSFGIDGGTDGTFTIAEPISVTEPTEVTVKISEGVYNLTLADGRIVPSPEVTSKFTVRPEGAAIAPEEIFNHITVSPKAGEIAEPSDFDKLTLTCPDGGYRFSFYTSDITKTSVLLQKKGADGSYSDVGYYGNQLFGANGDHTISTFDLKGVTSSELKSGEYRIVIPKANTITVSGGGLASSVGNPANFAYEYTLTGGVKELTYTTTPAAESAVDAIDQFSVNFDGVQSIAWANDMALPNVTLTCGDTSMSYTNGFVEGDDINVMVLDNTLAPTTPTPCTVKFGEGLYTLTLTDGTEVPSPAVEFTFTVGKEAPVEVKYTTTPEADSTVETLSSFAVTFADAKEVAWGSVAPVNNITLKYGNTTMNYLTEFFESDDDICKMEWGQPITSDKAEQVTVHFAAGVYDITLENGTTVPSPEVDFSFTLGKDPEPQMGGWVPVTDINMLNDAEVALVWYYDGVRFAKTSPEMKNAPVITMGTEECVVMNNGVVGNVRASQFTASEIAAGEYTTEALGSENKKITSIVTMPEDAAIVRIQKTAQGYTLYDTNAETPGYLCPQKDLDTNVQTINISEDPYYNTISINADGQAVVKSSYRDDANILSATTLFSFSGNSQCIFNYVHQSLDMGNMYLFVKSTGEPSMPLVATPANNAEIIGTSGSEEIEFSVGSFEQATVNASVVPTATFNGEAATVTFGNTYPVKANVTVPANAEGKLVVNIPEGWLTVSVDGTDYTTPAYEYTLNFKAKIEVADIQVAVSPEAGTKVSGVGEIKLTFPESVASVELNEDVAYNGGVEAYINGQPTSTPMMQNNTTFKYRPEMTDAGEYTFRLVEGFYTLTMADGTKALSPVIETTVTVDPYGGVADVDYTTVPAQGAALAEINEFSIQFEGVEEVSFGNVTAEGMTLSFGDTTYTYGNEFAEGSSATAPVTTMVLNDTLTFDTATTVTVKCAEGFYMLTLADGRTLQSPAVEFSFTVDKTLSIASILADGEEGDVYTTSGIRVLRKATNEQLKQLAPGMYICNGRVILKK